MYKRNQSNVCEMPLIDQGWGLLSRFTPFRYFPNFSTSPKYLLAIEYHVHIWQVSPQLSCGDTCQIWMRFKECNRYFCDIEKCAYREIDERSFNGALVTPTPETLRVAEMNWQAQTTILVLRQRDILVKHHINVSQIECSFSLKATHPSIIRMSRGIEN